MEEKISSIETNDSQNITVIPSSDTIPQVQSFVEIQMEKAMLPMRISHKMSISVDELFTNIVQYSSASWAKVSCHIDEEKVEVIMLDNGVRYNPLLKTDPDVSSSLEKRQIGGLGIFMAKKLLDELDYEYSNNLNKVTLLIKRKESK
ncbi:MAG: ATP-binding protein [Firmicutes bacterium]|nr:ATP-binding protein [Bacillota bacterium]